MESLSFNLASEEIEKCIFYSNKLFTSTAASIVDVQITGLSMDPMLYCPTDMVVYTCETGNPTILVWNIPGEFAQPLDYAVFAGMAPPVGATETDPNTGAVARLTVVEADRWVSTLTITNPGSRLTASTVTVVCVDIDEAVNTTLSAIGETSFNYVICLVFISGADKALRML